MLCQLCRYYYLGEYPVHDSRYSAQLLHDTSYVYLCCLVLNHWAVVETSSSISFVKVPKYEAKINFIQCACGHFEDAAVWSGA